MSAASLLDTLGQTGEAKKVYQKAVDGAADPAAKANAHRSLAMSYAFDGDCRNTIKFEQMVIDYWVTVPDYYQQGEMANEAARVCIDSGDLDRAEKWYKTGHDLGIKEPNIAPGRRALWEFRTEHALARIRNAHVLAQLVLEDLQADDSHAIKVASGSFFDKNG